MRRAEFGGLLLLALLVAPLRAAPEVAVDVAADHGDIDLKAGRARYWGNVVITHGTTRIEAQEVLLELKDGELDVATITGDPARFRQTPAGSDAPTVGVARRMTFRADQDIVELRDGARVVQGSDEVAGELIRYDVKRERVLAAGGEQGQGGRVQMTITPRKPKAEPPPAAEPPP